MPPWWELQRKESVIWSLVSKACARGVRESQMEQLCYEPHKDISKISEITRGEYLRYESDMDVSKFSEITQQGDADSVNRTSSSPYQPFSSHDLWNGSGAAHIRTLSHQPATSAAASSVSELSQGDKFEEVVKDYPSCLPKKMELSDNLSSRDLREEMDTQRKTIRIMNSIEDGYIRRKYGQKEVPGARYPSEMLPKWTDHVKINPETELEGPHHDGYSWRKYGQKDILGYMYPRSYYRCVSRSTPKCCARKHEQRSDEDPTVFMITYRGTHTCSYVGAQNPAPASPNKQEQQQQQQQQMNNHLNSTFQQNQSQLILSKLKAGLRVEIENLDNNGMSSFPPFTFPSTSFGLLETENNTSLPLVNNNSNLVQPFPSHDPWNGPAAARIRPLPPQPAASAAASCVSELSQGDKFEEVVKDYPSCLHKKMELSDNSSSRDLREEMDTQTKTIRTMNSIEDGHILRKHGREQVPGTRHPRKTFSRCTNRVKINLKIGLHGPSIDDGYRWRKYGQKYMRGGKCPREYYKCTSLGCPARKWVQRSDEDPAVFEITYRGEHRHTCRQDVAPYRFRPSRPFLFNKKDEFELDPNSQKSRSFIIEMLEEKPESYDEHSYEESDCLTKSDNEGNKLNLKHMDKKKKAPEGSHRKKPLSPPISNQSWYGDLKDDTSLELSLGMAQKKIPSEGLTGVSCVSLTAHIIEKILNSEVGMVGIHGTDEIARIDVIECLSNSKTLRSHFDRIILVTWPANCGMMTVKLALAELPPSLCIKVDEDDLSGMVAYLLKSMKFLLVLDNVKMQLDLKTMGIPMPTPENGSKIIIVTGSEQVCTAMALDKMINLDDEISWDLFCQNAKELALSAEIQPVAREIVTLCNHCSRAIILMAQALKNESEYSEWIFARNKLLLEVGSDGKVEDIINAALEFSFENLEDEMTIKCLENMAFNNNKDISKETLISKWMHEGVLDTFCEGNKVLENLIDLKLLEVDECGDIVKLQDPERDIFVNFIVHPKESFMYIKKGGLGLVEPPDDEEWQNAKEICLMQNNISKLPENPCSPSLSALYLHKNHKLRAIPSSFFLHMPSLQVLNLSETRIKSLPESLFQLSSLRRLFLRNCNLLRRLPPEIRNLKHLEVLDLEGTKIVALPEAIRELENLVCLEVSIAERGNQVKTSEENPVIPGKVLSALSQLEELNLDIDSEAGWWDSCIGCIIDEVCSLKNLDSLNLYFPTMDQFSHFNQLWKSMEHPALSCFKFIVGRHANRIMSQIPTVAESELERWDRCLMYINGVGIHSDISERLSETEAFLLERNSTVKKLSEFGVTCLQQLKCCVLGECNELRELVDGADIDEEDGTEPMEGNSHGAGRIFLGSLEHLYVYYMKNLTRIWKGPLPNRCLSNLKCLTLKTCPKLTCVFTKGLVGNLCNLEELVVDDCPAIVTLITCKNVSYAETSFFLPMLRSITLHYVPELMSISGGLRIAPKLELLSFYNCEKLRSLSIEEVSSKNLRRIRGEPSWWKDLQWSSDRPDSLDKIFVPFDPLEVP